jgi:hypothetical protein
MINYQATTTTYTGLHGNGELTSSGYADVSNWPGLVSGFISSAGIVASTTSCRGGGWWNNGAVGSLPGKVADRTYAPMSSNPSSNRLDLVNIDRGARGVHTKPIATAETK